MRNAVIAAFGLAALIIVAATTIVISGHAVPDWFPQLALVAAGGGAGIAIPNSGELRPTSTNAPEASRAP